MSTPRQERLAEAIIANATAETPLTMRQMLEKAGYDPTTAKATPGRVIEQVGVQEALEVRGFTEENAKKVVSDLMNDPDQEGNIRLKAADMTFKVKGSYAPEKRLVQEQKMEGSPQDYVEAKKMLAEFETKLLERLDEEED